MVVRGGSEVLVRGVNFGPADNIFFKKVVDLGERKKREGKNKKTEGDEGGLRVRRERVRACCFQRPAAKKETARGLLPPSGYMTC